MNKENNKDPIGHYYILDPSALVYGGIGKIKQWVEKAIENFKIGNKSIKIIFYVPSYTLKELDFLKKLFNPLISANARESIKFIDNQISDNQFENYINYNYNSDLDSDSNSNSNFDSDSDSDSDSNPDSNSDSDSECNLSDNKLNEFKKINRANSNDYTDFESYNKIKIQNNIINNNNNNTSFKPVTFILETDQNVGPDWKIASGYRRSTPLLSQLPKPINGFSSKGQLINDDNRKFTIGVFGNNIPGSFNISNNNNNNSNNNINIDDEKAVVPIRLKFLIRSCIQKQYIENKNKKENDKINWDIICEDSTTSIWLKSFGLSVKTLNEVQHNFDDYSGISKSKVLFDPTSGKLVETLSSNNSKSNYRKNKNKKKRDKKQKEREKKKEQEKEKENFKNINEKIEVKDEIKNDSELKNDSKNDEIKFESKSNSKLNSRSKSKSRSKSRSKSKSKSKSKPILNSTLNPTNPKNDDNSINKDEKTHILSADSFAERTKGELWTP